MTEAEWLGCDDPDRMLQFLQGKASERKLRLFACACVRRVWGLLAEERSRKGVEVSERYADGLAGAGELLEAAISARKVDDAAAKAVWPAATLQESLWWAGRAGRAAVEAAERAAAQAAARVGLDTVVPAMEAAGAKQRRYQCGLLRDLFGSPFRPVTVEEAWLAWGGGAARNMARAIYDERAFDRLPILGDALEDAGCTSEELLSHCRQPGEHVRGCWAVDLLLGKG
jgi:hypothetical protein